MTMEIRSTTNLPNLDFQNINCLILKRRMKEKITTTLSFFSLFLLEMRVVCFSLITSYPLMLIALVTMQKMLKRSMRLGKLKADGIEEKEDDDPQLLGEAKTAMKEVVEIIKSNMKIMFVSGVDGTGKSFLIQTKKALYVSWLSCETEVSIIGCPGLSLLSSSSGL